MMNARDLAKYIISAIKERMTGIDPEEFDVTPLKLQKLLYYCQGYSLALTGKPAFSDRIEAWRYGPVVESVYQEYKRYNGGIIPHREIETADKPDDVLQSIVNLVLSDKGRYSGEALARMTHKERPWQDSYKGSYGGNYLNAEIPNEAMTDYFSQEFLKREEDYGDTDEAWDSLGEPMSKSDWEAVLEEI